MQFLKKIIFIVLLAFFSSATLQAQMLGGVIKTYKRTATVISLNCGSASHVGTINVGQAVGAGVTSTVGYTGGNATSYQGFSVNSTGVEGLTATLNAGTLNAGNGNLVFNISGVPNQGGVATFNFTFAGKTCTLTRNVFVTPPPPTSCTIASAGTMTLNSAIGAGVTQTISLNVTTLGPYSITSTNNSGIVFAATGTFTTTGLQNVVLTASGTPSSSGNLNFTVQGCTFTRYVRPLSTTRSLSSFGSNGCSGCAQGGGDLRTTNWTNNGGTFNLTAGNYSLSFNLPITANGNVCNGAPNKPLEGLIRIRLRNTTTNATYLQTGGNRTTFSGCQTRFQGNHSAGGSYSGNAATTFLPAGTYQIQYYGESYMGGCSSGGSDTWAGCGISSSGGGSININAQN